MSSNGDKSVHGVNGQASLETLITTLKSKNYIIDYQPRITAGYPGLESQFYFQFAIEFSDGAVWILHSTTSIRDRINIQQWHSDNIKKIDNRVECAFVVYPDMLDEDEQEIAVAYNKRIIEGRIYSAIDGVLSQTEIFNLVEERALQSGNSGSSKARKGLNFESRVAQVLSDESNFKKWKTGNRLETGYFYRLFQIIIDKLGLDPRYVRELSATANSKIIGLLPTRGKPKTDIILKVDFSDNTFSYFTFSCKRSSSDWVSAHQYSAESFIQVLGIQEPKLKEALYDFQQAGSLKAFGTENSIYLTKALKPYRRALALWVYGGINGYGKPDTQWARFMITYKNDSDECDIFTIDEYIYLLEINGVEGHFGTLFNWTYASGERGKSIQLKSKVI